jgi:hypothetical protein
MNVEWFPSKLISGHIYIILVTTNATDGTTTLEDLEILARGTTYFCKELK